MRSAGAESHVMRASRGSERDKDMADTLARTGPRDRRTSSPRSVPSSARSSCPQTRAPTRTSTPPREAGVFHQSSPSIYAAALEALDLGGGRRLSFLNIGSGTGYSAGALRHGHVPTPAASYRRTSESSGTRATTTWARARATDVFYDVGDVFDVVEALRDAHCAGAGRYRPGVYVGAGVDRSSCRVLLRSWRRTAARRAARRPPRRGAAAGGAVRRGAGERTRSRRARRVAFASLVRPGAALRVAARAARRARLGRGAAGAFPPAFRAAAATLARGVARGRRRRRRACRGTSGARRSSRSSRRIGSSARRRRRPARVRSVRPARREVLVRPRHVLLARLPARGFRRARCCLHGAAGRRPRRCRRV